MGGQLVATVCTRWAPHISDRAFRVLVRMSATALDTDDGDREAGMYFAGQDPLAETLRAQRGGTRESAYRTVRRGVSELVAIGAIECVVRGRRGSTRAVYRLTLDGPVGPKVEVNVGTNVGETRSVSEGDSGLQSPEVQGYGNPAPSTTSGLQSPEPNDFRTPESTSGASSGLQSPDSGPLVSALGTIGAITGEEPLEEGGTIAADKPPTPEIPASSSEHRSDMSERPAVDELRNEGRDEEQAEQVHPVSSAGSEESSAAPPDDIGGGVHHEEENTTMNTTMDDRVAYVLSRIPLRLDAASDPWSLRDAACRWINDVCAALPVPAMRANQMDVADLVVRELDAGTEPELVRDQAHDWVATQVREGLGVRGG